MTSSCCFPVNPTTLAKYREAFCLSHAKDDPTDAELALELLMPPRQADRPASAKRCHAHLAAAGGAAPHPGG